MTTTCEICGAENITTTNALGLPVCVVCYNAPLYELHQRSGQFKKIKHTLPPQPNASPHTYLDTPIQKPIPPNMDLRDYFAGQAISGILGIRPSQRYKPNELEEMSADAAYKIADAMLKRRQQ